jgi:hypothetical protein
MEDDDDCEQQNDLQSKLHLPKYAERLALLMAARVVLWDEIGSQHSRDFACAWAATNGFKGKILITIGDLYQITPVVRYGTKTQILAASFYSSLYWTNCLKFTLTKNLRLIGASEETLAYAKMLDTIASGNYSATDSDVWACLDPIDEVAGTAKVVLPTIQCYTNTAAAVEFVHPDGFHRDAPSLIDSFVLAATNERVNHWNTIIQELNESPSHILDSVDTLSEVDDPYSHIAALLTTEVLNRFSTNEVPPHSLHLKVGDICILLRNLDRSRSLSTNRRVRILSISKYMIRVETVGTSTPITACIPRITFTASLPYGRSFKISRKQFPLRLGYGLSINRCQGQTVNRALMDITVSPFSHGHLFVALSRVRLAANMAFFCNDDCLIDKYPFVTNTVYRELSQLGATLT